MGTIYRRDGKRQIQLKTLKKMAQDYRLIQEVVKWLKRKQRKLKKKKDHK